ncbi:hypothetical protein [Draconibacterium mangrovi]|uniref:hypothetical protein n=1 Tax=Draconibacterium mangrovi TaxID=2697469 RepID=UPI0013CFF552|nr:hypothetical protein [Draconibacterium mangrovi]
MEYPINLPELEDGQLKLVTSNFYGKPKIFLNDFEIKKQNDRYSVNSNYGNPILITLKNNFLDPIPKVFVNNNQIHIAKEIKWYEYIWTGLPILMVLQGGLLGALLGLIALRLNLNIFRGDKKIISKYLLTLGISLVFVICYLTIATLLNVLIEK